MPDHGHAAVSSEPSGLTRAGTRHLEGVELGRGLRHEPARTGARGPSAGVPGSHSRKRRIDWPARLPGSQARSEESRGGGGLAPGPQASVPGERNTGLRPFGATRGPGPLVAKGVDPDRTCRFTVGRRRGPSSLGGGDPLGFHGGDDPGSSRAERKHGG